jgi:hypothetical protein
VYEDGVLRRHRRMVGTTRRPPPPFIDESLAHRTIVYDSDRALRSTEQVPIRYTSNNDQYPLFRNTGPSAPERSSRLRPARARRYDFQPTLTHVPTFRKVHPHTSRRFPNRSTTPFPFMYASPPLFHFRPSFRVYTPPHTFRGLGIRPQLTSSIPLNARNDVRGFSFLFNSCVS